MHFNTIVQRQYCPIMFLIRNIFLGLGLYPTPTVIATGRNCRSELGGCTSTLVLHLAEESVMEFWSTSSSETDCCEWRTWRLYKVTGQDLFFVSEVLLSTFILLFLLPSSVSLYYFYLAVPMRLCLEKHSCMSMAIGNGELMHECFPHFL